MLDTVALLLRWFDHWLKDSGAFAKEPRVRYFARGLNRWFEADDCCGAGECTLYLHSGGRAESRKEDGNLSEVNADDESPDVFVYAPEVPVVGPLSLSGAFDQSAVELGDNLLVYTSEPLMAAMHVFDPTYVVVYMRRHLLGALI